LADWAASLAKSATEQVWAAPPAEGWQRDIQGCLSSSNKFTSTSLHYWLSFSLLDIVIAVVQDRGRIFPAYETNTKN
jgi:hypothetical protein